MSERHDAIVRLLDTRYEHLPEPVRRSEASPGFAHRAPARVSCPDCLANDRTMFGCETCCGRGYTEVKRDRDPYATDVVDPYGLDGARHEAARARDRQIDMLGRQTRPAIDVDELADANAKDYAWAEARKTMYKLYDYAALDRALDQLHLAHPGQSPYSERGLGFLDERLPEKLRVPGAEPAKRVRGPLRPEAGLDAKDLRDAEMRQRAAAGADPVELAKEFRVSIRTVYRVVNEAA